MLDINGVTATGSTFFAAIAFIHNEQQPSYDFALTSLRRVYEQLGLEPPCTILTDKEKALINACKAVFPDAYTMICLWHVNKNILSKARPLIRKEPLDSMETLPDRHDKETNAAWNSQADERWKRMLEMWWKVVRAPSYPESEHAWKEFRDQYDDEIFGPLVAYIEKEWLNDDTRKQILYCFTDKAFHLDMRTTSRGEASHSRLKKDLGTLVADHFYIIGSFERKSPLDCSASPYMAMCIPGSHSMLCEKLQGFMMLICPDSRTLIMTSSITRKR